VDRPRPAADLGVRDGHAGARRRLRAVLPPAHRHRRCEIAFLAQAMLQGLRRRAHRLRGPGHPGHAHLRRRPVRGPRTARRRPRGPARSTGPASAVGGRLGSSATPRVARPRRRPANWRRRTPRTAGCRHRRGRRAGRPGRSRRLQRRQRRFQPRRRRGRRPRDGYPDLPFATMLNAKGREVVQKVETSCIVELALADPFGRLNDLTTVADMIKDPRWQARLAENRLGTHKPAAPVLLYHGRARRADPVPCRRGAPRPALRPRRFRAVATGSARRPHRRGQRLRHGGAELARGPLRRQGPHAELLSPVRR